MAGATSDEVDVPPTLQALLAARLDQLDPARAARARARRGRGRGLPPRRRPGARARGAAGHAAPRRARAQGADPARPAQLPGEDGFRFRHLLIRDAAYDALPKATRAELHERFADWLEERGADLVELDEILGYHLEQALATSSELGAARAALARRAGDRLAAAGRRALWRGDTRAAASAARTGARADATSPLGRRPRARPGRGTVEDGAASCSRCCGRGRGASRGSRGREKCGGGTSGGCAFPRPRRRPKPRGPATRCRTSTEPARRGSRSRTPRPRLVCARQRCGAPRVRRRWPNGPMRSSGPSCMPALRDSFGPT